MAPSTTSPRQASMLVEAARDGNVRLGAVFGGQGPHNPHNLEQLEALWHSHGHAAHVSELFERSSQTLEELVRHPHENGFHDDYGFNLQQWISDSPSAPATEHLAQAPISFPLNTLLGLVQYCIACDQFACPPGQFASNLVGATGHSQGIFVAAAVALSDTWDSFWEASELAIKLSFAVGLESQHDIPASAVSAAESQESVGRGVGEPTPMLSVAGLSAAELDAIVQEMNAKTHNGSGLLYLALENSRTKHVVSGSVRGLWKLSLVLDRMRAADALDQTRVLFNERKPAITMRFLPVSAPFHSPYLKNIAPRVVHNWGLSTSLSQFVMPLVHPLTGDYMTIDSPAQLVQSLIEAVTVRQVNWPQACDALNMTHVLDFGPGRMGDVVLESSKRSGMCIVNMTKAHLTSQPGVLRSSDFYSDALPPRPSDWECAYGPRLSESPNGQSVETKMTKLFGCPPVMVPGMVPTSVSPDFVIAVMKAGYHAELGGGGYSNEAAFEKAVREVASQVPPHRGVTCNILYANPQTVAWQVSCLRRLLGEGVPVSGITIGAGIPSEDVVADLVENMGLRHISFKPGSARAIEQVVAIAQRYPHFPIGLQWTGGRAGGHHSFEDFHEVMLAKYAQIRSCSNIVLIAGSGFGGGEDSYPYVSGAWAVDHGFPPMPFDGVLVGSRMMVAQEAHTSPAAKVLITQTKGVSDAEWHQSYRKPAGGVVTIISEMGEPMHVIANRGTILWKHLDEKVFSIRDGAQRAAYLAEHGADVIARLNADSAKPWFAVDSKGCSVALEDMTYHEVLVRLCQLTWVRSRRRWIDVSYRRLVLDFVQLTAARHGMDARHVHEATSEDDADSITRSFASWVGAAADEVLWPDDVFRIIALFRRRGQKPVPFVPALDARFETWYKKDSLWQSEDVEAVVGQDVQRVVILQGPVAARFSTEVDEPAHQILHGIHQHFMTRLASSTNTPLANIPSEPSPQTTHDDHHLSTYSGLRTSHHDHVRSYIFLSHGHQPSANVFRLSLAGTTPWLQAALVADRVFSRQTCRWMDNPIRAAMTPGTHDVVQVFESKVTSEIETVTLLSNGGNGNACQSQPGSGVRIAFQAPKTVSVTLTPQVGFAGAQPSVVLHYSLESDQGGARLYEQPRHQLDRVRDLYHQLWLPSGKLTADAAADGTSSAYQSELLRISGDLIRKFEAVVRRVAPSRIPTWTQNMPVPLDTCVVFAWEALVSPLMSSPLRCDFLHLLHQSVDVNQYPSVRALTVDDVVKVASRITAVTDTGSGRRVEVSADIMRDDEAVVNIKTVFFLRGVASEEGFTQFEEEHVPECIYQVDTDVREAILKDRRWLRLDSAYSSIRGRTLVFRLTRRTITGANRPSAGLQVSGKVLAIDSSDGLVPIGSVEFETANESDNVVVDFLRRNGTERYPRKPLEQPGWTGASSIHVNAPIQSKSYALASTDFNPIHTCPVFARFAGLPGTVVHGMNTSAIVKRLVQNALGDTSRSSFQRWKVMWEDMVIAGEALRIELQHSAMERGAMVIDVNVYNDQTGNKIMVAEATVEQAPTAYVFCGQGSQKQNMGMKLYDESSVARAIWDRGDRALHERFGFSILNIVRENPRQLRIKFGGKRGRLVRENYLTMAGGDADDVCVVPGITAKSIAHTFSDQRGLLFSTQFSQPAVFLMELAEFEHLRSRGVVTKNARFAGHSLGEYAALASCTSFMPLERLVELLFFRGAKMQSAVPRDHQGRTAYGMVAVDPSRVGNGFDEETLHTVVQLIVDETQELLEVVNHNVRSQQYVCAGHFRTLHVMTQILDRFSTLPPRQSAQASIGHLRQTIHLEAIAAQALSTSDALQRGKATIPLRGIEVPFHSRLLRHQIVHYRNYLSKRVNVEDINPAEFVGRWVPNVTGSTFSTSKSYVEEVQRTTGSEELLPLLEAMA